jgi:hypothetical protein
MIARNKIREWQLEQRNLLKECEFRFGTAPRRKYDRESIRNRQGKAGIEDMQLWTGIKPRTELPKREYKKRQKTINFSDYKYLYDGGYSMGKNSPVENIRRDSDYLRSLNDSDRFAVERYTGGSYSAMNDYFRKGISGGVSTDKKALAVKKVLDDAPELMENTILFRHDGLGTVRHLFNDDARNLADKAVNAASAEALIELKKLITNATFTEKGFLSTSYAKGVFTQDRGLEVQLYMPKGFNRGLFVEEVSNFSNEREFVIGQGQKFKVVDVEVGDIISNMHDSEPSIRNLIIKAVPIK